MSYCKNWTFTLNNFSVAELATLQALENNEAVNYIVFQHEIGTNNTPHIQGYVQFAAKKRMAPVKRVVGLRCHVEKANGTPDQNRVYCTKEEGRVAGPWEYGAMSIAGKRNDVEAIRDAVRSDPGVSLDSLLDISASAVAKYPNFIATLRNHYTTPLPRHLIPRSPWQNQLSLSLDDEPDPRTVRWYYDPVGSTGKSYFSRNWVGRDGKRAFVVSGGKHADVIYAYQKQAAVFFDFTREVEERVPYSLMEGFKNGYLFSSKYQSMPLYFNTPHVVCFANFEPDRTKLSADRWIIQQI